MPDEGLHSSATGGPIAPTDNVGCSVATISREELYETYWACRLLESTLLRHVRDLPAGKLDELRGINDDMRACISSGDVPGALAFDKDFHFGIVALSRRGILLDFLETAWGRSQPYRMLALRAPEAAPRITAEHEQMLHLLEQGDIESLVALHDAHRDTDEQRCLRTLNHLRQQGAAHPG